MLFNKRPHEDVTPASVEIEAARPESINAAKPRKIEGAATRSVIDPWLRITGNIEGEAELFTGGDSDWVGDIRQLRDLGVTSVDVRLFGYGEAQSLQGTIDNMHRFRDGVLSKLA